MKTDLHLVFQNTCRQAFDHYETVFNTKRVFTMTFAEAPGQMKMDGPAGELILHTAMPLGSFTLMGCDTPPGRGVQPIGGMQISVTPESEDEVRRIFAALSEGGRVDMPLMPTFWAPLFGMCTDKFGVGWMVNVEGPPMAS